jgi:transposase-like protein
MSAGRGCIRGHIEIRSLKYRQRKDGWRSLSSQISSGSLSTPERRSVQILHPFTGSVQQYFNEIRDPDRYRPDHCPQCQAGCPLTAHGFYSRTLVETGFGGSIPVRRYLCRCCKRTVSLLPEFALPYLRFSIALMAMFLIARLLGGKTLNAAAVAANLAGMPYQRGQFWVRRFRRQAENLSAALAALIAPPAALVCIASVESGQGAPSVPGRSSWRRLTGR